MTLQGDLITMGYVRVGTGGTASAQYPCLSVLCTDSKDGPEGQTRESYRRRRWTMRCWASAASVDLRQALRTTIEQTLARRGHAVEVAVKSGLRTMPAPGASGALPGYPIVEVSDIEESTQGPNIGFTVTAETVEPIADGAGTVEHTSETEEELGPTGLTKLSVTGTVRRLPGENAKTWVQTNVLDPAAAAADTANRSFEQRTRVGLDASVCEYSYTAADTGSGSSGISRADISDVTSRDSGGRLTRTISGSAEGSDAATFAAGLEPTPTATQLLTTKRVSAPSTPDGRVTFTYELLSGVQPAGRFGTLVVFSHQESLDIVSGGARIQVTAFLGSNPVLSRGPVEPYVYEQVSSFEFTNGDFDAAIGAATGLMDADNLVEPPRVRRSSSRASVRRITVSRRYMYATEPASVPEPRELPDLEDWP